MVVLVVAVPALASCTGADGAASPSPTSRPGRDLPNVSAAEIADAIDFVEATFDAELVAPPRVLIGTRDQVAAANRSLDDDPEPLEPSPLLLDRPGVDRVLGLQLPTRSVLDAGAWYDGERNEIVLVADETSTSDQLSPELRSTLVHEMTHALFPPQGVAATTDRNMAEWIRSEGLAGAAQGEWDRVAAVDAPDPAVGSPTTPDDVSLIGLSYALGDLRFTRELFGVRGDVDRVHDAVESAAVFFDPSLPLGWSAADDLSEPVVPEDTTDVQRDRIGMSVLAEVVSRGHGADLGAVLGWRGDITAAYRRADGELCVASRVRTVDDAAADRLGHALEVALAGASVVIDGDDVLWSTCGERTDATEATDFGRLASQAHLTNLFIENGQGGQPVDSTTAWCASGRLHDRVDWKVVYRGGPDVESEIAALVGDCRR